MKPDPHPPMGPNADSLARTLAALDPRLTPSGQPQPLPGGLLNHVWRVRTPDGPRIVKVAPPFVASAPSVPLDSRRIVFEAEALSLFGDRGILQELTTERVRPPRLIGFFPDAFLLVLEDLGDLPHLGDAFQGNRLLEDIGRGLGTFIGRLHGVTSRMPHLEGRFRNTSVQQTRRLVQYRGVARALAARHGMSVEPLARSIAGLGDRLLRAGRCLVMGDLWPRSVLMDGSCIRLIDWEFVHFGRPLQDVAHLAAHTWMSHHRAADPSLARQVKTFENAFILSYGSALGSEGAGLWDTATLRDASLHMAAEILARTIGAFRSNELYPEGEEGEKAVQEAVDAAIHIAEDGIQTVIDVPLSALQD